jgi:hypothetical protein
MVRFGRNRFVDHVADSYEALDGRFETVGLLLVEHMKYVALSLFGFYPNKGLSA